MALYAAYGTNLDPEQMRRRCPHSPVRGVGWLESWRLTFGGEDVGWEGALTTLVEEPLSSVYVMLYDVPDLDEKALDEWESYPLIREKIRLRVTTLDGSPLAWVYVVRAYEGGLPSCRYLGMLAEAAEAAGAPQDYLDELRSRPCKGVESSDDPVA
ncbi:MAG TPA: gamma-glutamylcyclotransferase family protein [Frankiaceae bacterium]|nr:gamma-glutamylcyclotransferase family protein [Frankiaceae bacterium]